VARQDDDGTWHSVAKRAPQKAGVGGRKTAVRELDERGVAVTERVLIDVDAPDDPRYRRLVVPLVRDGVPDRAHLGVAGTRSAREHHAAARAELPADGTRLSGGEPAIPTIFGLG
jgi:nicotinate phosphoribosyltransferase